jgi:hypothetical protein
MPVHRALPAADAAFASALAHSPRGPDRDGVFALWLVVRAALGAATPGTPPARHGERLKALQQRLKSLNVAPPLRRSLTAAIADLTPARAVAPAIVLAHLVAPAADTLGRAVADAVTAAARAVRGAATRAA